MHKKERFLIILFMLFFTACGNQEQSTPTQLPRAIPTSTQTLTPTQTASPISTFTSVITSTADPNILKNELITFASNQGIKIISGIGGTPITVIQDYTVVYFSSPSWSPDGNQIAFFSEGNGVAPRINIVNKDGSGLQWLRSNVFGYPAWSPDGEDIAYVTGGSLYLTSANGSSLHQLTKPELPIDLYSAWSPDGRQLAILGDSGGYRRPYKIYLINRDGTNLRSITDAIVGQSHLTWSPDGKRIAFRSFLDCGDINILDLATGIITNITNSPSTAEIDPAWSADGNFIAYTRSSYTPCYHQDQVEGFGPGNLYIVQVDGKNETQLTTSGGYEPSWWPTVILKLNWRYSVTKAGDGLNIRETTSTSAKSLAKLKQGELFTALEGPMNAENYVWWLVRTEGGIEGWCVDVPGWYMFESSN